MTEKRFEYKNHKVYDNLTGETHSSNIVSVNVLNELHEENEHYKALFFEIVETALTDKNCRELYCKGILNIFDKANSLNQARDMIKEYLE